MRLLTTSGASWKSSMTHAFACCVRNWRRVCAWHEIEASNRPPGAGSPLSTTTTSGRRTSWPVKSEPPLKEAARWAYVGAVNVTEDLRVLGGAPPAAPEEVMSALPRVNLIPGGCSGVAVRRDLLPPAPFDPTCRYAEDWDLWIRLSRLDRPALVNRPLVGYRVHAGNRSLDLAGMVAMLDVIEQRYGGPVDRAVFYRYIARLCQRASRHGDAVWYCVRAAAVNHRYRQREFLPDLIEVAQGAGRQILHRLAFDRRNPTSRTDRPPAPRYAAQQSWVDEARQWLGQLAAHHLRYEERRM